MSVIWGKRGGVARFKAIKIPYPSYVTPLFYSGSIIYPEWINYDETQISISGTTSAINAGTYTVTFTLKDGFCWEDETMLPYTIEWIVEKRKLAIPSQNGLLTYNGSVQTPTWSNYNSAYMIISGTTSATNVPFNGYYANFDLINPENYMWNDGTTTRQRVRWDMLSKYLGTAICEPSSITLSLSENPSAVVRVYNDADITYINTGGIIYPGVVHCTMTGDTAYPMEITFEAISIGAIICDTEGYVVAGTGKYNAYYQIRIPVTVTA